MGTARTVEASCGGWILALTILMGLLSGALSVWAAYKTALLVTKPAPSAFCALVFAFSSPLFPFSTSAAHYSHVYLTAAVSLLTYLSFRIALVSPRPRDGLYLGIVVMIATLQRVPAVLYAVLPAAALLCAFLRTRAQESRFPWLALTGLSIGGAVGVALTCALYIFLYGSAFVVPQGPDYLHFNHLHPFLVLFGIHGGFFFWMPAAWVGVFGLAVGMANKRTFALAFACMAASVAEISLSSAPLDWHGNWTLGARRLLPLTPFLIVFSSMGVDRLYTVLAKKFSLLGSAAAAMYLKRGAIVVVLLCLVNNIPAATVVRGDVNLSQAELYGKWSPLRPAWQMFDRMSLDLALLPAELYFVARYRLPLRSYREVLTPRYRRNYRTLEFAGETLDFRDARTHDLVGGANVRWSERGLVVSAVDTHFVFASEWPFATHARFHVVTTQGTALSLSANHLWSSLPMSTVTLEPNREVWVELALPPEGFDSGINDWVLRTSGGDVTLQTVVLEDRTPRVPHG